MAHALYLPGIYGPSATKFTYGDWEAFIASGAIERQAANPQSGLFMTSPQLLADPRSLLEAIFDIVRSNQAPSVVIDRIFDSVPAAILITKPTVRENWPKIVYVNRHFCNLYSYPREKILNGTTEIICGERTDIARIAEMREEVLSEGISRFPMLAYDSHGREHRVRVDVSTFALSPSPPVDLWIGLHVPLD